MTVLVAALLVPVLTLLPGYSLLPSRYPRRLRLPFVIFASVAVTSVVGLALMLAGHFSVPLLAALEAPLLLLRRRARDWPVLGLAHHVPALLLMVVVAIFAVLTSGEPFDATGDAGVYTISSVHLRDSGRWSWPLEEVIPADVPEDLVIYEAPLVRPWREVAPGFIVRDGLIVPQFFPLFPVWGAVFSTWFGVRGVLAANLLGALMLVVGCDALFRLLLGRGWRLAALAVLLLNPIFLVFVKYPSAEVFLAGLLAGWLLWMVLFLRAPTVGGSVLPASLLALAVLTKFFAWAVAGAVVLVCALLPWRYLRATAGFALLLPPAFALDAWLATPHLENHLGQLLILSGFKLVLVGCGLVLLLRLVWSRVARAAPPALAVVYIVTLGLLWSSDRASHARDFAALSGPLVVWGTALGLAWYLWRRRAMWLVLPAFVFVLLSLYLFLGSGDSPYYPFAARRYLPITVPLGALFLVYVVRGASRWLSRRFRIASPIPTAIACLLLAAAVVPALWVQRPAVLVRQGAGFLESLAELQRTTGGHSVVLATGQAWRYAPHLLLSGNPVFCLDLRPPGVLEKLDSFLKRTPGVVALTNERRERGVLAVIAEDRRAIRQASSPPLEVAPPRPSSFRIFSVERREWTVPDRLDVGADDQMAVAGFHQPERAEGRSFRWTGGHARMLVGPGERVRFVWSKGGNPQAPLPVSVFARGLHIGDGSPADGWRTSRWFDVPDGDGPVLIEIRAPTFQPALLGRSNDRRDLGLCLDAAEIR